MMYDTHDLYGSSDSESRSGFEDTRFNGHLHKRNHQPTFYCMMCEENIPYALLLSHVPACYCLYIREKCGLLQSPFCLCVACNGLQGHNLCQNCVQNGRNLRQTAVAMTTPLPLSPPRVTRANVSPAREAESPSLMTSVYNRRVCTSPRAVPEIRSPVGSSPSFSEEFGITEGSVESSISEITNTSQQVRSAISSVPGGTENLPTRQALMTIHTNPAGGIISSRPRTRGPINFDSFTSKQHRGVHCILCNSKSNDKLSKTTPMIRVGKYRGYLVCKKSHFSAVLDEQNLINTLAELRALDEPVKEITLKKIPVPLQSQWQAVYPTFSEGLICDGYLDVLPTPTSCTNAIQPNEHPIWLHDIARQMHIRYFCSTRCAVFFLKNKYPGNKKGPKSKNK